MLNVVFIYRWSLQQVWLYYFQPGSVDYVAAKNVNESDGSYEDSEQFKQKVSFYNSSVHIPLEIYEGG